MSSKQDRTYTRTASDLEQKYNFGQTFADVYGLINDVQTAVEETQKEYEGLDAEEIFNRLTNYGRNQAILRDDNGNIYINANYIKSGTLAAEYIDADNLKVKAANITGTLSAEQIDATNLEVNAAQIVGKLSAGQIDATDLVVSAANISGALTIGQLPDSVATTNDIPTSTSDLTNDSGYLNSSGVLAVTKNAGYVTESGVTTIVGGIVTADYVNALGITVKGTLSAANVDISGLLAVKYGSSVYGYLGASTASTTIGTGVAVCDSTASNGFLAMTTGAKMMAGGINNQIYIVSGGAGIVADGVYYRFLPTVMYPLTSVDLGASSAPWGQIYSTNSAISTSDREKKNSIVYDMDERYDTLWSLLKPCTGKYNDGTSDRTHMFLISQDVEDAIEESGLTSQDFAAFIKSPKQDKDGNVLDGYNYALRYEEFIPLCIRQIQKLQMRVSVLEGQ